MRKMKTLKKLFAWVLVCAMFVTLMPVASLAAEEEETVEAINVVEDAQDNSVISVEEVKEETDEQEVEQVTEVEEEEPVVEEEVPETKAYTYDVDEAEGEMQDTDSYSVNADGDDDNAPLTEKTVTDNEDGTYKITLDITGKVDTTQEVTRANVLIVLDRSGSMDYTAENRRTRMYYAKQAIVGVANTLLGKNGVDGAPNDMVEMALITFGTTVSTGQKTSSLSSFTSTVNNVSSASGVYAGTNWEGALQAAANFSFGDTDPTYVIFVSDGNPTFRVSRNPHAYGDDDYTNYGVYGTGSDESSGNVTRCYTAALDDANAIVDTKGYSFYTIGAYGNVDRMEGLTNYAYTKDDDTEPEGKYYYPASSTTALNEALEAIASAIEENFGQTDVSTTDGITDLSHLESKVSGTATGFKYYKKAKGATERTEWTDGAPEAEFKNGGVTWDLSSERPLEDGTTYTVEFDVWPSQEAYDTIADLNNGLIAYDDLSADVKSQIKKDGDGYVLLTNTDLTTTYTYNGETKTKTFDKGESSMKLTTEKLSVKKLWENTLDSQSADSISLRLTQDGTNYLYGAHAITLSKPEWSQENIYIAPGVMRNGEVLELGHDYALVEEPSDAYHWELEAAVYHPMVIDGVLTILKADDGGTITINNKKYSAVGSTGSTLTATNHRRSNLNLTKTVVDNTAGKVAPADAKFGYKINIVNSNAANYDKDKEVYFSVWDADSSDFVYDLDTNAEPEMKDGKQTGYFFGESGKDITVKLQAGWNLRILNLPTGSDYTIVENSMPGGFEFASVTSDTPTQSIDVQTRTITGKIDESNHSYQVEYTNNYEGYFYVYHTSMTGNDDGVIEAISMKPYNADADKTFNIFEKTAAGTYYGGYYNNYYYTGEVKFEDPANPTVTGGKAYAGQLLGFYTTKATSYKENGKAMHPIAGTVYYLKEVPTSYIQEKVYVRNNKESHATEPLKLNKVEPITCIDDKNYQEHGFYFGDSKENVSKLASVFVETQDGEETRNENGKSLFSTPNNGYLVITDCLSKLAAPSTTVVTPYWITPDGIEVKGTSRTIKINAEKKYYEGMVE